MSKISNKGFTLVELLIALGIIAVLAGVVVIAIDPTRQFAKARNTQRQSNINLILNAIGQNMADNKGVFTCASGSLPTSSKKMADNNPAAGDYDIAFCLVPNYVPTLPFDPKASGAYYASTTDYDTGYYISYVTSTNRVTVAAPSAELGETVSATR